jgi:Uma2 family endonuclease
MSTVAQKLYTPAEYLDRERKADYRSEYYDGEIFAMAGASEPHNAIANNIARSLGNQLVSRGCRVYQSDMRVKVRATGLYTYPDVVTVCGKPEFDDSVLDTIVNPTILVEVLSPSTANYDRSIKFDHYQQLESLKHFVLAEQVRPHIEVYTREAANRWSFSAFNGLAAVAELPAVGCVLPLSDAYTFVEFPEESPKQIKLA